MPFYFCVSLFVPSLYGAADSYTESFANTNSLDCYFTLSVKITQCASSPLFFVVVLPGLAFGFSLSTSILLSLPTSHLAKVLLWTASMWDARLGNSTSGHRGVFQSMSVGRTALHRSASLEYICALLQSLRAAPVGAVVADGAARAGPGKWPCDLEDCCCWVSVLAVWSRLLFWSTTLLLTFDQSAADREHWGRGGGVVCFSCIASPFVDFGVLFQLQMY